MGAFSVIAETNPIYGIQGLAHLREGKSIKEAILRTQSKDEEAHYRQVSGIDAKGNVFAFTGNALKYWKGTSAHSLGKGFVVMGNQLDKTVLSTMSQTFEQTKGTLAERLLANLIAGQRAGGQISGKQSAALVVKGLHNQWYNQIDLRVDHSDRPFQELQRLLDYHYGRIRLNQSLYAWDIGNKKRAFKKLQEAEKLLEGWNGMYSKIALAHSLMGDDPQAIRWIQKGLLENPHWRVNLPAFYYLHTSPALSPLIQPETFSINQWEDALTMLIRLGRSAEAIQLAQDLLAQEKSSSHLYYLLGKAYQKIGKQTEAIHTLNRAIEMDTDHVEARLLREQLQDH